MWQLPWSHKGHIIHLQLRTCWRDLVQDSNASKAVSYTLFYLHVFMFFYKYPVKATVCSSVYFFKVKWVKFTVVITRAFVTAVKQSTFYTEFRTRSANLGYIFPKHTIERKKKQKPFALLKVSEPSEWFWNCSSTLLKTHSCFKITVFQSFFPAFTSL